MPIFGNTLEQQQQREADNDNNDDVHALVAIAKQHSLYHEYQKTHGQKKGSSSAANGPFVCSMFLLNPPTCLFIPLSSSRMRRQTRASASAREATCTQPLDVMLNPYAQSLLCLFTFWIAIPNTVLFFSSWAYVRTFISIQPERCIRGL